MRLGFASGLFLGELESLRRVVLRKPGAEARVEAACETVSECHG
jgi:hypothetical protein